MTAQRHDRHVATERVLAAFEPLHRWRIAFSNEVPETTSLLPLRSATIPPGLLERVVGGNQ